MSQPTPRKAALRAPNGSGNDSPSPEVQASPIVSAPTPRQPLPQHPHTHIPPHPRHHRGGRSFSKPATPVVEESPEVKTLRAKYGPKLQTLKEIYPDWQDEDLLSLLSEVNGHEDTAVTRIAEGKVQPWGSVSHKKDKKERILLIGNGHPVPSRDGAASPGRGGFRGGRGGYAGGRGGIRGGRGGSGFSSSGGSPGGGWGSPKPTNGDTAAWSKAVTNAQKSDTPSVEATGADVEVNSGDANGWNSSAPAADWHSTSITSGWGSTNEGDTLNVESNPAATELVKPATPAPPIRTKSPVSKAPTKPQQLVSKMSWAQVAKVKPVTPSPAPPSHTTPAPSAALIEPPQPEVPTEPSHEATEPAPASDEREESQLAEEMVQEPVEPSATIDAWAAHEEEAQTAPQDDWITVSPPSQAAVELPPVIADVPKDEEPEDAQIPPVGEPATAKEAQLVPEAQPGPPTVSPALPPGLPAVPSSVPTPSLSTNSSTIVAVSAAKPQTPRMAHRASARYKVSDAPVVMPGGGVPSTHFGGLSFGNAIEPMKPAMQFGSLSLNDDGETPVEPSKPVPPPEEPVAPNAEVEQKQQEETTPLQAPPAQPSPSPSPVPSQPLSTLSQNTLEAQAPSHQPQPQRSPHLSTGGGTLSAINNLFQQAQQQQQQTQHQPQHASSLPHQVTSASSSTLPTQASQTPSVAGPSPLPSFVGAPGHHHHTSQQQQGHQGQQSHTSHLLQQHQSQLGQPLQPQQHGLGGPAGLGGQQTQQQQQAQTQQQHLAYGSQGQQSQLAPHLGGVNDVSPMPAIAAQNAYFRGTDAASPYGGFHAPTPPQQGGLPGQLQQDHTSTYGGFVNTLGQGPAAQQPQLGQPGQSSHLGGFAASPATDYGAYDAQTRGFYDSYTQGSGFQSRSQLGHEDPSKTTLPPSSLANALPNQQTAQAQAGNQSAVGGQQAGQYGMMPYFPYQQPYFHPLPTHQYNPYGNPQNPYAKYPPYTQPPSVPGGPPPVQQQGNKPPAAAAASPYGSQSHLHYPNQNSPYDDPTAGAYQATTNAGNDYGKQQPLYGGQALGNFYGAQNPGVQNGPQLGTGQGQRSAGVASTSSENPYKPYNGPGVGADKAVQQQGQQGRGVAGVQGSAQTQQGGFYPNRYPQPAAQRYPQSDGQFYPTYQQGQGYWQ